MKFKQRELKFDANSILQRAPRLVIFNTDSMNPLLPDDKIFINAFGRVKDNKSFNNIPANIFKFLDNLQRKQQFVTSISDAQNGRCDEISKIQQSIMQNLLDQHERDLLSVISTYFGTVARPQNQSNEESKGED